MPALTLGRFENLRHIRQDLLQPLVRQLSFAEGVVRPDEMVVVENHGENRVLGHGKTFWPGGLKGRQDEVLELLLLGELLECLGELRLIAEKDDEAPHAL